MTKIALGCDHAGYLLKEAVLSHLKTLGEEISILDFGTHSDDSVDYPDFVHPVAEAIEAGQAAYGILICGSANGVAMTANKHLNIRAAVSWNTEIAKLARSHNDANIICLPARFISEGSAKDMVQTFLDTPFEGGRHTRRVNKISNC